MATICPTCGAVTNSSTTIPFTKTEQIIHDYVAKYPACTIEQIHAKLYGGRHVGAGANTISVMIHRINAKLTDSRITASNRGPGATYRLVPKDTTNASV